MDDLLSMTMTPSRPPMPSSTNAGETPRQHPPSATVNTGELTYVWGTGIALETFRKEVDDFFTKFGESSSHAPYYIEEMYKMALRESEYLEVDFSQLKNAAPSIYKQTVANPSECLQIMASVADNIFLNVVNPNAPEDFSISIAARNLPFHVPLRELSPHHIETLVSVRGMVVRTSKVIPEVRVAHFQCWNCQNKERSAVERGRIFEPVRCMHCGSQYTFQLIHNMSLYEDKQIIRLQEAPENLADGETPATISVVVYGTLVDSVVPGDRVSVSGIYRSSPLRLNSNTRIIRSVFRTHVDGIHIEKSTKSGNFLAAHGEDLDLNDAKKVDVLRRIAKRKDIYKVLLRSLAPAIWGHEDVKEGILRQMFGGTRKKFQHGKFRAELNVILCGDPGVAKSQLLTHVHQISPRGVYTSGKGSSSVGLTAFVVKDADTGEFVLEPGALVLSDRGICCIDEFDKMDESTRSVLHEVMEQQTLSVAKAGIIAQLNARTSILAAANPKESQWNPTMNIVENLQIEPTLLSRFDLIFLLLDKQDEAQDRHLASHVLSMYMPEGSATNSGLDASAMKSTDEGPTEEEEMFEWTTNGKILKNQAFSHFVAYAREMIHPSLTEDSHKALASSYVDLRKVRGSGKTVSATLRQLESMIRLAEGRAKMRYSATVNVEDVEDSKKLISSALKEAATDPRTGLINLDMFAAPDPTKNSLESCILRLENVIATTFAGKQKTVSVHELRGTLNQSLSGQRLVSPTQFTEILAAMSGGTFVETFTTTTVTLASTGGGSGSS